jgi:APA family basic amino acid/polyamine antiporter
LVVLTITALLTFSLSGLARSTMPPIDLGAIDAGSVLPAIAFLFVAYTGYGRIATLGEEVHRPGHTIPRAVLVTLAVAIVIYGLVELGGRSAGGSNWGAGLIEGETPADLVPGPWSTMVSIGAVTAMLGVLLNLVLGLSRVWLAMGRRLDMPQGLARLDARSVPVTAIVTSAVPVAGLTLLGDISLAWSFSAFSVLLYYGITNLAALRLDRRRLTGWLGLASCLFLSFFVPIEVWLTGAGLIAIGLLWKSQRRV